MFNRFMSAGGDLYGFLDALTPEETMTLKNMCLKGAGKPEIKKMTEPESRCYRFELKYNKEVREQALQDLSKFSTRAAFAVTVARGLLVFYN